MKRRILNAWNIAAPSLCGILAALNFAGGNWMGGAAMTLLAVAYGLDQFLKIELADQRLMAVGANLVSAIAKREIERPDDDGVGYGEPGA